MKKETRIIDFLPSQKNEPEVLVQARVRESLRNEVRDALRREGRTWEELLTACFEKFLNELKKK